LPLYNSAKKYLLNPYWHNIRGNFNKKIMKNNEQDPALQTPSEANRDKHMNYLAAEDNDESSTGNSGSNNEEMRNKHDADSGNDGSSNAMLQQEELIDPGNEHTERSVGSDEPGGRSPRHDADSGGDGTGSMGSKPE
jgi:hypothetical protein